MTIGNWLVSEESISWTNSELQRFEIPLRSLNRTTVSGGSGLVVYEWLILALEEDWLTSDDHYDLNFAFVFAAGKYSLDFDYAVFDDTLDQQFNELDIEEDEV